ncbi:hypothetical protein BH10PLA1_BH10PLA1_00720 [soil metagenome]
MTIRIIKSMQTRLSKLRRQRAFARDFERFTELAGNLPKRFTLRWSDRYPCLNDATSGTDFDRVYVYHTAWAARVLKEIAPKEHVDFSSSLYFVAIASAIAPIRFFDYRPANLKLPEVTCEAGDLMSIPFADQSLPSVSCLHVVEHIGLGRYGDPLDPDGDVKAMRELQRIVAPGGSLIFATPVGKPRICFNAHRIYRAASILEQFSELSLHEFSLIPDRAADGHVIRNASLDLADQQDYGCGCFWFKRPA